MQIVIHLSFRYIRKEWHRLETAVLGKPWKVVMSKVACKRKDRLCLRFHPLPPFFGTSFHIIKPSRWSMKSNCKLFCLLRTAIKVHMVAQSYLGSRDPMNMSGAAARHACSLRESHTFLIIFRQNFAHARILVRRWCHTAGSKTCGGRDHGSPSQPGLFSPRRSWFPFGAWLHLVRELSDKYGRLMVPSPKRHKAPRREKPGEEWWQESKKKNRTYCSFFLKERFLEDNCRYGSLVPPPPSCIKPQERRCSFSTPF